LRYHYSPEIDKSPSVDRRGEGKKKTDKTAQKKKKNHFSEERGKQSTQRSQLAWLGAVRREEDGWPVRLPPWKDSTDFFFFDERLNGLAMCVRVFLAQADFWTLFGFTRGL
jgi:hypothetical protein